MIKMANYDLRVKTAFYYQTDVIIELFSLNISTMKNSWKCSLKWLTVAIFSHDGFQPKFHMWYSRLFAYLSFIKGKFPGNPILALHCHETAWKDLFIKYINGLSLPYTLLLWFPFLFVYFHFPSSIRIPS